jgi:hypothetical protein
VFTNAQFYGFNADKASDLLMQVNRSSGAVAILSRSGQAFDLDFYQVLSESGSLDPEGWTSLASQGFDGSPANPAWGKKGGGKRGH